MNAARLGRLARMLRVRQRLTQVSLAARAGVSRRAVSFLELGRARSLPLATVETIVIAVGDRLDLRLLWKGPELDRLLDEGHAELGAAVKPRPGTIGWAAVRGGIGILGRTPIHVRTGPIAHA